MTERPDDRSLQHTGCGGRIQTSICRVTTGRAIVGTTPQEATEGIRTPSVLDTGQVPLPRGPSGKAIGTGGVAPPSSACRTDGLLLTYAPQSRRQDSHLHSPVPKTGALLVRPRLDQAATETRTPPSTLARSRTRPYTMAARSSRSPRCCPSLPRFGDAVSRWRERPSRPKSGHRESHPVRLPGKQPCCCHTLPACAGDERWGENKKPRGLSNPGVCGKSGSFLVQSLRSHRPRPRSGCPCRGSSEANRPFALADVR